MEDDVGRHALFAGEPGAQCAQGLEQGFVHRADFAASLAGAGLFLVRLAQFAQLQGFLAAQQGAAGFGQVQGAITVHVHAQVATGDELTEHAAPFGGGKILADAVGAEPVVAEAPDALVLLPAQHVDQIIDAETLAGAVDAGQGLLRGQGGIPGLRRIEAGVAVADIMAGMYATTAVLAALHSRSESGHGQHIDVPLYDSQVAWLANQNMNFLVGGGVPKRMGSAHPNLVPYQAFASNDGDLMLTVGNDRQFVSCCDALGLPSIANDRRFASMSDRVENREVLIPLLQARLLEGSTEHWLSALHKRGVPAGPVNDIAEVLTNEHAVERGLVRHIQNGEGRSVPQVSNPVTFGRTPVCYGKAPPLLGEHTNEVLREWLGYSDAQIDKLRQSEII